jgi:hypothetical protein
MLGSSLWATVEEKVMMTVILETEVWNIDSSVTVD